MVDLQRIGEGILVMFFAMLIIMVMVEGLMLVASYYMADKVECNWLWCTFTKVKENNTINSVVESRVTITKNETITRNCYENDISVNCSKFGVF